MKVSGLLRHIDTFAPFSIAEDWDNSGLLVGSYDAEVDRIAVTLDAVTEAVILAREKDCNVLVCHHPIIFRPVKNILDDNEQGRTIREALKRNVNIIAVHTNWDKTQGGVNDTLAALIGLNNTEPLDAFGVRGIFSPKMTLQKFSKHVKNSWGLSHFDVYTNRQPEKISRVSICGGSGGEFWRSAKAKGSDIFITADMKYHDISDAVNDGLTLAICDHGEMERASIPALAGKIEGCGIGTVIIETRALPTITRI
ncbi:MAG: Nif3-like dinuclear metal center hexameric protein [Synergistaceae bacterium]|nr:Nif3-like dinuclear metal center hexameric protein [Synergistaceae bacterium]